MKVFVFAGTTEGREIAEWLAQQNIPGVVSAATQYGGSLLPESEQLRVVSGRMDAVGMENCFREEGIDVVVDATHPFAREVTKQIKSACEACGVRYIRCLREISAEHKNGENIVIVPTIEAAVDYLEKTKGNIFVSTGSKELEAYQRLTDYRERCYVRVLSVRESIEKSIALGFEGKHLIAMQGPFSVEANTAMLRAANAAYFVTKESGKTGGFDEKAEAARLCGAKLVVIGRPAEEGYPVGDVCAMLKACAADTPDVPPQTKQASENSRLVWKNQKQLRTGYTTGSCAAAAAKAAARMLFHGTKIEEIPLVTPSGARLNLKMEQIRRGTSWVSCAVRKDSGDDPDVTNGMEVYACVSVGGSAANDCGENCVTEGMHLTGASRERTIEEPWGLADCPNIRLYAGTGIGIVRGKGLEQKPGEPAINSVPRQMICGAVREELALSGYPEDTVVDVTVWAPGGESVAARTFNPRLGIEGGISILGTSGIVEPMSEKALTDTILLDMRMKKEQGKAHIFVVPGNYGVDFLRETFGYKEEKAVKCSNFIGEAIDDAVQLGMESILLVGHVGKLVKLAAGIMNTHSRCADGRMEILAAHAAMAGAEQEMIRSLMQCVTTTDALDLLEQYELLVPVMETVSVAVERYLKYRAGGKVQIGAVIFSKERGILGKTSNADTLAEQIRLQEADGTHKEESGGSELA